MTKSKQFLNKENIRKLRERTGAGIMDCRRALENADGDINRALESLKGRYREIAAKKVDRETEEGMIFAYVHGNSKVGAIISLLCETDFVARTKDFQDLGKELAMQTAAMNPNNPEK
ncbi:MAG: hypothetical protein PHX72_03115, partial [Candidatus Shapirobacteria bacterium]|nr:hypothetical protein [Candidatus Shapirobacteria bacterium]